MLLAVNVGTTYINAGCMSGTKAECVFSLKTDLERTDWEYAVLLGEAMRLAGARPESIDGAIIASVVPPVTRVMRSAVRLLCKLDAMTVGAGLRTGLNIRIDDPAQLGSDLAVAAVGALASYAPPLIVLNIGTATTFSVINSSAQLLGGAIMPGVSLALGALADTASQLPRVPVEAPKSCIGRNTVDCMKSGAVFGAAAAIDGMVQRIEAELGERARVVAAGELAPAVLPACRREITSDPELILRGLAVIYAKNKK